MLEATSYLGKLVDSAALAAEQQPRMLMLPMELAGAELGKVKDHLEVDRLEVEQVGFDGAWMHIAIAIYGCKDPALPTSEDVPAKTVFCTAYVAVENFHCQTCPRPWGPGSSSYLCRGCLVPLGS